MSDDSNQGLPSADLPTPISDSSNHDSESDLDQDSLISFEQFFVVEKQRIDSYNRRTELGHAAINAQDAADKRQMEYHMERLRTQESQSRRQHGFARLILFLVVGFCSMFTCVILGMLFFGDASQAEHASVILRNLGIALGGGGAFYAMYDFFKRLLAR